MASFLHPPPACPAFFVAPALWALRERPPVSPIALLPPPSYSASLCIPRFPESWQMVHVVPYRPLRPTLTVEFRGKTPPCCSSNEFLRDRFSPDDLVSGEVAHAYGIVRTILSRTWPRIKPAFLPTFLWAGSPRCQMVEGVQRGWVAEPQFVRRHLAIERVGDEYFRDFGGIDFRGSAQKHSFAPSVTPDKRMTVLSRSRPLRYPDIMENACWCPLCSTKSDQASRCILVCAGMLIKSVIGK